LALFIEQDIDPYKHRTVLAPSNPGCTLELKPNQIPVWLSFLPRKPSPACMDQIPPPGAIHLGAVFDSGYGHTLALSDRHLRLPEAIRDECLDRANPLKLQFADGRKAEVPRLYGDLWVHSNCRKDETGRFLTLNLALEIQGIAYIEDRWGATKSKKNPIEESGPRVPLLGTATLCRMGIDVCLRYSDFARMVGRPRAEFFVP
jgi:hypothetical protein